MSHELSPEVQKVLDDEAPYTMRYLYQGIQTITTGQYTLNNREHPLSNLALRWGRLPGFGMYRAYELAANMVDAKWMAQKEYQLTDQSEYRRWVQKHAAHCLAEVLSTEMTFADLRLRRLPDPGDIVPDTSTWPSKAFEETRDKLCNAVLYQAAAQTHGHPINCLNGQIYTWDDLLGDVVYEIYSHARQGVVRGWTSGLIGSPYQRLYATADTALETSKVQVLNRRFTSNHEVTGSHERTITPTPPNSESGGSPRARQPASGAYSYGYNPTEGMNL